MITAKNATKMNQANLDVAAEIMRALAHPLRLQILSFIDKKGTTHVNRIYTALKLEQSITSQHLRILRSAGLVKTERDGKFIFYSLDYKKISEVNVIVKDYFENWNEEEEEN